LAGLGLSFVNPYGPQTVLFPLGTLTSPLIQNSIQEWASPDFHSLAGRLLEALIFILILGLGTGRVRASSAEWLSALALLVLAFASQRHVPLFVLAAAPLLGRCAQAVVDQAAAWLPSPAIASGERVAFRAQALAPRRPTLVFGLVNLVLLVVVGAGMFAYRALPNLEPGKEQAAVALAFPTRAASAMAGAGRPLRVFNDYGWGGYLIWTGYPAADRVFIDGRVEVYGDAVFRDYLTVSAVAPRWRQVLDRYQPDAVLFPTGHPLLALLEADPGWRMASSDPVATLLLRVDRSR
jgi:hypothetical protein